jgi:hypothetical protein
VGVEQEVAVPRLERDSGPLLTDDSLDKILCSFRTVFPHSFPLIAVLWRACGVAGHVATSEHPLGEWN